MRTFFALVVMFMMPLFMPVLPVPGLPGLLAGLLGGYLVGRARRAMLLALLPCLVAGLVLLAVGLGVGLPLVGAALAGVALVWYAFENLTLVLGAALGGLLASRRAQVERPAGPAGGL
jgi:hypothetical protein